MCEGQFTIPEVTTRSVSLTMIPHIQFCSSELQKAGARIFWLSFSVYLLGASPSVAAALMALSAAVAAAPYSCIVKLTRALKPYATAKLM